jgi:hypothetical protein
VRHTPLHIGEMTLQDVTMLNDLLINRALMTGYGG